MRSITLRSWIVSAATLAAFALPASAVVKVYDATPPHGAGGDEFQYSTDLCPPIQISPNYWQGHYTISDTGSGTVTATEYVQELVQSVNFGPLALVPIFGPGSYVFTTSLTTFSPTLPATAPGNTAPGGSVDWGVLGGFTRVGEAFCISSPQTICTGGTQVPHGITTPISGAPSPTYDLGTWSYDAEGDFQAASNYIVGTFNGGTSNRQALLRGSYVGGSIPALPLVGVGAVALGLLGLGTRTVLRRK